MEEKPNYIEDAVSIAIGSHLALLSFPFFDFSIVPISRGRERWLGADARLLGGKRFLPFYMQFKRPFAHTAPSRSKIIKDRNELKPKLTTAPRTLYFSLQNKQKHHKDFQHNVLYRLRQKLLARGCGDAAYVCPLFLDRQTYFHQAYVSGLKRWFWNWPSSPYDLEEVVITSPIGTDLFEDVPLLAEHISIPPHAAVSSAAHKYSFTEKGDEVCFHSPKSLADGSFVYSDWLMKVISQAEAESRSLYFAESAGFLRELIAEALGEDQADFEEPDDPVHAWFVWGDYLYKRYAIEQYGIIMDES